MADNSQGNVHSGPGIRAVDAVMRGTRLAHFPSQLEIPPGEMRMFSPNGKEAIARITRMAKSPL